MTAWKRWNSDAGRWYATRTGDQLTFDQIGKGLAMTIGADTADELDEQLAEQAALETKLGVTGNSVAGASS